MDSLDIGELRVQSGDASKRRCSSGTSDGTVRCNCDPRLFAEGDFGWICSGSISGEYAGGLGEQGVDALREFVRRGGTLIAFNNASLMAIDALGLPVTNVLADLKNEQFFCSGSLLRVELRDLSHPALWGMHATRS